MLRYPYIGLRIQLGFRVLALSVDTYDTQLPLARMQYPLKKPKSGFSV